MISPTMFFNLVLGVIAALKVFTVAFIARCGSLRATCSPRPTTGDR